MTLTYTVQVKLRWSMECDSGWRVEVGGGWKVLVSSWSGGGNRKTDRAGYNDGTGQ